MIAVRNGLKAYQRLLTTRPVLTNSIQTGILMAVGDMTSQNFIERKTWDEIDITRTLRFGAIGVCLGPALYKWYVILERIVGNKATPSTALKKMVLDQTIASPSALFVVLSIVELIKTYSVEQVKKKLKQDYFEILITNYKVWPIIQTVNFYIMPLEARVLVVQIVAIFWNTYLAYMSNLPIREDK